MKFLLKKLYIIICKCYSELVTFIENIFFRGEFLSNNHLEKFGYVKLNKPSELSTSLSKLGTILSNNTRIIDINEYHKRIILSKKDLNRVLGIIFNNEFCEYITLQTGFKYIVDYLGAYQNLPIPNNKKIQPWYANHFHLDKPNSKNMLKIFVPVSDIGIDDGPLELLDINQTKSYYSSKKILITLKSLFIRWIRRCFFKQTKYMLTQGRGAKKRKKN